MEAVAMPLPIPDITRPATKIYFIRIVYYSTDRKSTRLNSSHVSISYAVFCLKKKKSLRHVFPSAARNLLFAKIQEKADSSGKNHPRNDNFECFSAPC